MAQKSRVQLKGFFEAGKYPSESQFADLIDSFFHYLDNIPLAQISGLQALLEEIATGLPGADGPAIEMRNYGGWVQWRVVGDVDWINLIQLTAITGPAGADGADGADGANGINPEIQYSGGWIQWRLVGGGAWINLVEVATLIGGASGSFVAGENTVTVSNGLITSIAPA